jgi:ribonuclease-3
VIQSLIQQTPTLLLEHLGYKFHRPELMELAFTHKSYANEIMNGSSTTADDNERLEFLGDAVLDLALSDVLMTRFPLDTEGALSKKRASLVNEDSLSTIAKSLGFDQLLRLGKGEIKTGGLQKPRILASGLEAIIGAVFQDSGYILVSNVIEKLFEEALNRLMTETIDFSGDFKTRLQERAQSTSSKCTPTYRLESESGPDHEKIFNVVVELDGRPLAQGSGKSKKSAEQDAAKKALETL